MGGGGMPVFMRLCAALAANLILLAPAVAEPAPDLDPERIAVIDAHALAATPAVEASPELLAKYLVQPARNDAEKARAIFRWMTDRVSYDVDAYFGKKQIETDAEDVLKSRSSICDGYATLFEVLAKAAGLEVASIRGYAKGYLLKPGVDKPNHAWNAVRIDGRWYLIDSTWGAGYVKDGHYQKALSEVFFLIPPEQLMFSHFPSEAKWQLQSTPMISKSEFDSLPQLEPAFFHVGVPGEEVWKTLKTPGFKGEFVHTFDIPHRMVAVLQAPLDYHLPIGQTQNFKVRTKVFEKMAAVQGDQWLPMEQAGDTFTLTAAPAIKGAFFIMGKKPDAVQYTAILGYAVE
jgi:hypothetical protein